MSTPSNQTPTPNDEEDMISVGRAIGDSLAGNTDPQMPAVRADWVKLTLEEETLLAVFREHPGQALTPEHLADLANSAQTEAGAPRRSLTPTAAARIARSLDRKLAMGRAGERIRDMSGVGYILWR